jgi:predicted protein tyrosine phosphatase
MQAIAIIAWRDRLLAPTAEVILRTIRGTAQEL